MIQRFQSLKNIQHSKFYILNEKVNLIRIEKAKTSNFSLFVDFYCGLTDSISQKEEFQMVFFVTWNSKSLAFDFWFENHRKMVKTFSHNYRNTNENWNKYSRRVSIIKFRDKVFPFTFFKREFAWCEGMEQNIKPVFLGFFDISFEHSKFFLWIQKLYFRDLTNWIVKFHFNLFLRNGELWDFVDLNKFDLILLFPLLCQKKIFEKFDDFIWGIRHKRKSFDVSSGIFR